MTNPQFETRAYDQLCETYRAIDDFRSKLLGFLPVATGAGVFALLKDAPNAWRDGACASSASALAAVGIFSALITLGLFSYEIYGIRKCHALIYAGKQMEMQLEANYGQFRTRPQNVAWVINEPFAAAVIYPAVLAAWTFFALHFESPNGHRIVPVLVFSILFVGTLVYDWVLREEHA